LNIISNIFPEKYNMSSLELPQSIITRLIREGQSQQTSGYIISKDFKAAFQQLGGYFSLYLYSVANDIARESRRKKVTEEDVYQALKEVGFEKYLGELKDFMANYNADKEDTVGKAGGMAKKRGPAAGVTVTSVR
jgi:histone H3/H4